MAYIYSKYGKLKLIVCLLVVLMAVVPGLVKAESPVYFADPNLKAVVESSLGVTDPTPTDMLRLTDLSTSSSKNIIVDLTGLEYATNLWRLILYYNNQVTDISPLSGLTNLVSLSLLGHHVSDISPLAGLINLYYLDINGNLEMSGSLVSDISPLSGLKNLKTLWLVRNQISDISPLSGLTNLKSLQLDFNQVSNLLPIAGLTGLTSLTISSNPINDVSPLSGLTNLTTLWMSWLGISDISALSGMTNLQRLDIMGDPDGIKISDISVLSGLTNLTWLEISQNIISDVSALSGLTNLTRLNISHNPLNNEAYCTYLPVILANNPSVDLTYNPNPYPINFIVSPASESFDSNSGIGNVSVTTTSGCSWIPISNDPWITITSPIGIVTGNGNVNYSVSANTSNILRTGTITIAENIFTITQAASNKIKPGTLKWEFMTGVSYSSPSIGTDGTVYVGSADTLYAIKPDGTKKWEFLPGLSVSTPAIGSDDTLYCGSSDGKLYALNPDGTKKWNFLTGDRVSSPSIGADDTIYVVSADDKKIYALNPDGTKKWDFSVVDLYLSSLAIGVDGTLYFGSGIGKLYALNPDGTKKWEFLTGGNVYVYSPAIGTDGTIYVGSYDRKLYAINPDGTKKWDFLTGFYITSSPSIGTDGTIYVGSVDKKLYAINPDGTKKWEFLAGDRIISSPAIGADGTIYVGSWDNKFYAISPDGTKKWEFLTGGRAYSSPSIGADGTIYVVSADKLYAINSDSGGLADSPWPMFHHDVKHTGNVTTTHVANPILDVKANDSDVPITLGTRETLLVSVSLAVGSRLGEDCDWWVVADTPFGWYHYNLGLSWTPGLSFTHQGSLLNLSPFTVLNMSGLPVGTYIFYFAVDTNMNGSLDLDELFFDSVIVNITE